MKNSEKNISHGDFTTLASSYAMYRPAYCEDTLSSILGLIKKNTRDIVAVDIGAGTGIWTRMLASRGCKVFAVEPNNDMLQYGIDGNKEFNITWKKGSAETTGLDDNRYDLVTMASSFHWTDFESAIKEFSRILKPEGWFAALWNTRLIEVNPILVEIEEKLKEIIPDMKRVSSGRSEFCDALTNRLSQSGHFSNVQYTEGQHVERMTKERYMGIWRSVNDIQVQAGPERFEQFMEYIQNRLKGEEYIDATYLTRAWVVQIKK